MAAASIRRNSAARAACGALLVALVMICPRYAAAQQTMPTNTNPTPALGFGNGFAGVVVDANGTLRKQVVTDQTGQVGRQRVMAAKAALDPKVGKKSALRKVSLNRLEAAFKDQLDNNRQPTDEMRYLAGLTRVQYVFYYPETKDIVIAGPAEGWLTDPAGRVVGIETGRPAIELQDLITSLRAFGPDKQKNQAVIGCSIDPTKEGLAKMQAFLKKLGGIDPRGNADNIASGLRENLGLQNVTVTGVPATTHFARVMVEADYRMKLIGIGLERPPVKMASYIDKATPGSVSRNAMQRWYFVPDYQCVRVANDGLGMRLEGEGVKLIGADEMVSSDGTRTQSHGGDGAGKLFVDAFTKKYPDIAAHSPVYGQLRNLIDLAVASAFIQDRGYFAKAGWKMETFASEDKYKVETLQSPKQVESAVAAVWKNNTLMTPIGGGVHIEPLKSLDQSNLLTDDGGKVQNAKDDIKLDNLAKGQWWWD